MTSVLEAMVHLDKVPNTVKTMQSLGFDNWYQLEKRYYHLFYMASRNKVCDKHGFTLHIKQKDSVTYIKKMEIINED